MWRVTMRTVLGLGALGWALGFGPLSGIAAAGDGGDPAPAEAAEPSEPEARGGLFGGKTPVEAAQEELEKQKTEEELAREQRLAEFNAANADKASRVVVLQWQNTDTTYADEALQRNIKNRIARTNAKFFPEVDLYQHGRLEPDKSVRPADQQAVVPDSVVPEVMALVEDTAAIPFDAMSENQWSTRAGQLLGMLDKMWFVDRKELREPLFMLYAQLGRAAENTNQNSPPYYRQVDGKPVNYYFYLAGALAYDDPSLLAKLTAKDLYQSVSYYKDQIDSGQFSPMTLSFDQDGVFNGTEFVGNYQVFVNGVEKQIKNQAGLLEVPIGVAHVHLKRSDGFSLSERIEHESLPDRFDFVLQTAKKRMGIDFIEQLMEHPSDCMPQLAGDIVNYLAIYAKLHPNEDIYIAVPFLGSTSPGRIYLWRWDRNLSALFLVQDNTGGFPIRFVAMLGGGMDFSAFKFNDPDPQALEEQQQLPTADGGGKPDVVGTANETLTPELTVDGVPIYYQLRGHFNHLLGGVGLQYKIGTNPPEGGGKQFVDVYQTQHKDVYECEFVDGPSVTTTGGEVQTSKICNATDTYRERDLQRLVYMMWGVTFGKDAAVAFGPRAYLRLGWYNAPHALDVTGHFGISSKTPWSKKDDDRVGRVRALLDADFYGGAIAPVRDTMYILPTTTGFMAMGKPNITFGFTAGIGLTF